MSQLSGLPTDLAEHVHLHDPAHEHDQANHGHKDHAHKEHGHTHGLVDPSIIRSKEGVKAVSISFAVLLVASIAQFMVYGTSHSIALLADVIHNAGDAMTAIPLGLAFFFGSKRGEKWAGYSVVFAILVSAILALYEVVEKFIHPQTPSHLLVLAVAGVIGIVANEVAAVIRWRTGKKFNSAALIADGNHARADGFVSLGVVIGAAFIGLGFPVADPLIGLVITGLILQSVWQSWQTIKAS